jgi:ubiquinone/menaquinone biosynthesis C-methylase UbiE
MLDRMAVQPGQSVLEVGCGPGTDLFELAPLVHPGGHLAGADASEVLIAEARRRAADLQLAIEFKVGDAQCLDFADSAFDVCRASRLLEHLSDAHPALKEMVRVTRPGGRVVVYDFDWDTLIIDHPDKNTKRTIVSSYADSMRNGWIGRQLRRLFREQCLEVRSFDPVQVFAHYAIVELFLGSHLTLSQTRGLLSPTTAQAGWQHLRSAEANGSLLISFTSFEIVGTT